MDTDNKHPVDSVDVVMPTETAPLLGGDAKADARSWKGPWWQILGDGSAPDVAAFCLSWNVPALAFGWNAGRGLSKRWWLEALKYFLLSVGLMLLGHFIMMVVTTTACGPKHPMPHRHPHPAMMMRDSFHANVLPVEPMYMYADDDEGFRELMEVMGEDQGTQTDLPGTTPLAGAGYYSYVENYYGEYQPLEPHLDLPAVDMSLPLPPTPEEVEQCMDAVAPAALSVSIMMVLGLVVLITYAARRRTMMRERFGIPGSSRADCCLWTWCAPCALAQETRTMMHNNVEEGLWLGPHQVVYTAPAQQEV
ncbi:uncharacterized protein HaLaN_17396 [Haematococcus lacustris]|uniref:Uncharacterized protein n=1 Tax=Haematococcus lacustris TaxID=44745 RepID=A0A699ZDU9_HAELA|nr:uncharacterized protein HaLaN_17396 [Haematococcus lacustris]